MLKSDGSHVLFPLIMEEWMEMLALSSAFADIGDASRERMGGVGGEGCVIGLWHRITSTDIAFSLVGDWSSEEVNLQDLLDTKVCEARFSLSVVPVEDTLWSLSSSMLGRQRLLLLAGYSLSARSQLRPQVLGVVSTHFGWQTTLQSGEGGRKRERRER